MSSSDGKKKKRYDRFGYDRLQFWTQSYRIRLFVYSPLVLAFLIFLVGAVIGQNVYDSHPPAKFQVLLGVCICIAVSFTGLIQILLREVPSFIWPVRGRAAVFWGVIWIAVCWFFALVLILDYFFGQT